MPSSTRAMIELEKGNIDLLYAASFTENRKKIALFSEPYRNETLRLFWYPQKNLKLQNAPLSSLLSRLVGVSHSGGFLGKQAESMLDNANIYRVPTIEQRMKMLKYQRADFTIEDELAGIFYIQNIQKKDIDKMSLHRNVIYQNKVSLMFSRKTVNEKTVAKINHTIKTYQKQLDEIVKHYIRTYNLEMN